MMYELSTHVFNLPLREVEVMHVGAMFYVKSCTVVFFFLCALLFCYAR